MNNNEKKERIERIKNEVNAPKDKLLAFMWELEYIGAKREAQTLGTIIGKLETWQNK